MPRKGRVCAGGHVNLSENITEWSGRGRLTSTFGSVLALGSFSESDRGTGWKRIFLFTRGTINLRQNKSRRASPRFKYRRHGEITRELGWRKLSEKIITRKIDGRQVLVDYTCNEDRYHESWEENATCIKKIFFQTIQYDDTINERCERNSISSEADILK